MRSVQFAEYGGPEVLQVVDVPAPVPGPGQLRVAVQAAGVNPIDWKIRAGLYSRGKPLARPRTPGQELAGIVDAVGPGAVCPVEDAVFGWSSGGSYAEYALARVVCHKPDAMSWQDAASLPVVGEAALRGLRQLGVQPGEVLLIHGASGAVGSLATQLAVRRGVRVIGTAGSSLEYVRSLGATPVPYGTDLVDRVLTIADPAAGSLGVFFSGGTAEDTTTAVLRELADEFVAGHLRIQHAATFKLAEAAEAQRLSENGHARGKITLAVV